MTQVLSMKLMSVSHTAVSVPAISYNNSLHFQRRNKGLVAISVMTLSIHTSTPRLSQPILDVILHILYKQNSWEPPSRESQTIINENRRTSLSYVNECCHKAKELILQPPSTAINTGIISEGRVWEQACAARCRSSKDNSSL